MHTSRCSWQACTPGFQTPRTCTPPVPSTSPLPRVELVDEPAHVVAPLLEGYRQALSTAVDSRGSSAGWGAPQAGARRMWDWMQGLPDANGRAHGVGLGSLEVRAEQSAERMKPTAASLR